MKSLRSIGELLAKAAKSMAEDQAPMMGAALAYYTMFSIAPLLVIAIGLAGLAFGDAAGRVFDALSGLLGERGASAVESMIEAASSRPRAGVVAAAAGFVALLAGASGVFQQLQQSLNLIWKVAANPKARWSAFLRQRLLSFAMVAVIGFILLVSMLVSAALSAAGQWAAGALPGGAALWAAVNFAVSLAVIGALFASVFKLLPDVELPWSSALVGGFATALLFAVGKAAIGLYLGRSGAASAYGAAGSLIVVLLWVFYSSQILFFGAEFTRAWATRGGRSVPPKPGAVYAVTPLNAASMAARAVDDAEPAPGGGWYGAAAGSMLLGLVLLARHAKGHARAVLGGLAEGAALGLLAGLRGRRSPGDGKGAAAKVLEKVPTRLKIATVAGGVGGALKRGGREAAREIREKAREKAG
ncbi:MAG TPA: YihY/virulence factor BrkB family protein [Elusimicrobiota bacterium]|jgi:membrane protein|nr:YihY/virulence factor BrkB family protein [Elusimicrobiota bacterium]